MRWVLHHKADLGVGFMIAATFITGALMVYMTVAMVWDGRHCERYTPMAQVVGKAIVISQVCAEWSDPQ